MRALENFGCTTERVNHTLIFQCALVVVSKTSTKEMNQSTLGCVLLLVVATRAYKPVIMMHGFEGNASSMDTLLELTRAAGVKTTFSPL
jgi:uncharacterized alpha/beta hydrolase family protein